jgi:hypothetical protein
MGMMVAALTFAPQDSWGPGNEMQTAVTNLRHHEGLAQGEQRVWQSVARCQILRPASLPE